MFRALPGDRFALDDLGAAMIGNPAIAAFVAHHDLFYDDLRDPVALLRGETRTRLSQFWPYAADRPGQIPESDADDAARAPAFAAYSELMSRSQALGRRGRSRRLSLRSATMPARRRRRRGRIPAPSAAARNPESGAALFDLPPVAERARARFGARGLGARVEVFAGSFLNDPLPRGADLISLVRVLHDHDDEAARVMLAAAHAALPSGGAF